MTVRPVAAVVTKVLPSSRSGNAIRSVSRILVAAALVAAGAVLAVAPRPAVALAHPPATWTPLPDQTSGPGSREGASMAYDPAAGGNVLFGGSSDSAPRIFLN